LGIAAALLGDPEIIMLDEPVNGLDPEGVRWVRELLRGLASEGRTVMLSSHLMSEMALTADQLVIVGRGRLLAETTVDGLVAQSAGNEVTVATTEAAELSTLLSGPGVTITATGERLLVTGLDANRIGQIAAKHRIPLYELHTQSVSLEEAFMNLTRDAVEYRSESVRAA
jgi:ABC-2 type transport system ATP-binding protein